MTSSSSSSAETTNSALMANGNHHHHHQQQNRRSQQQQNAQNLTPSNISPGHLNAFIQQQMPFHFSNGGGANNGGTQHQTNGSPHGFGAPGGNAVTQQNNISPIHFAGATISQQMQQQNNRSPLNYANTMTQQQQQQMLQGLTPELQQWFTSAFQQQQYNNTSPLNSHSAIPSNAFTMQQQHFQQDQQQQQAMQRFQLALAKQQNSSTTRQGMTPEILQFIQSFGNPQQQQQSLYLQQQQQLTAARAAIAKQQAMSQSQQQQQAPVRNTHSNGGGMSSPHPQMTPTTSSHYSSQKSSQQKASKKKSGKKSGRRGRPPKKKRAPDADFEEEEIYRRRKVKRSMSSHSTADDYTPSRHEEEVVEVRQTRRAGDLDRPIVNDILPVRWTHNVQVDAVPWGKIVEVKVDDDGKFLYYVHYVDYDRRLDEWVDETHLDLVHYTEHGSVRRNKRKKSNDHDEHHDDPRTKVKNVEKIQIGKHEIDSWYFSPYPMEVTNPEVNPEKKLFLCEFCLEYSRTERTLTRHMQKCKLRHPPGNEIYRDGDLSVFELDGCCERIYCENLCLLAKLYLDHKTLQYDVEPFLFYVMTVRDERGYHIVGYFSKEKFSSEDYNLACILTLPQYQKMGFGFLLIQFSYCLSRKEKKEGTPERPLSDLGRVSYESFWRFELIELLQTLAHAQDSVSIQELQQFTMMKEKDILHTLTKFDILRYHQGQHILCLSNEMLAKHNAKKTKLYKTIKQEKLLWIPHDFTRFKQSSNYI